MPDIREEFEKWAEFGCAPSEKALCWDAWQASRSALRVELPEPAAGSMSLVLLSDVRFALQQAGIEVK